MVGTSSRLMHIFQPLPSSARTPDADGDDLYAAGASGSTSSISDCSCFMLWTSSITRSRML